jgi:hypothetical protein
MGEKTVWRRQEGEVFATLGRVGARGALVHLCKNKLMIFAILNSREFVEWRSLG